MRTQPISRRILAAGLALAPIAGLPAIAAGPPLDALSPALCELWQEWLSLGEMIISLDASAMPLMARYPPGPKADRNIWSMTARFPAPWLVGPWMSRCRLPKQERSASFARRRRISGNATK